MPSEQGTKPAAFVSGAPGFPPTAPAPSKGGARTGNRPPCPCGARVCALRRPLRARDEGGEVQTVGLVPGRRSVQA
jgi:hypothetical protein